MEKMSRVLEKAKMLVGMEVDEEAPEEESSSSFMDDFNRDCTLSTQQRLYGFAICLAAGLTCTFLMMWTVGGYVGIAFLYAGRYHILKQK